MSTFTNRTTGNEIARNFFSGLKSYAFQRLRDFASTDKDWNALLSAISTWDEATVENEIKQFTAKYKSAATDFRFTVLRTPSKTLQVSEGSKSNMRLRPQDLDRIDLKQFSGLLCVVSRSAMMFLKANLHSNVYYVGSKRYCRTSSDP